MNLKRTLIFVFLVIVTFFFGCDAKQELNQTSPVQKDYSRRVNYEADLYIVSNNIILPFGLKIDFRLLKKYRRHTFELLNFKQYVKENKSLLLDKLSNTTKDSVINISDSKYFELTATQKLGFYYYLFLAYNENDKKGINIIYTEPEPAKNHLGKSGIKIEVIKYIDVKQNNIIFTNGDVSKVKLPVFDFNKFKENFYEIKVSAPKYKSEISFGESRHVPNGRAEYSLTSLSLTELDYICLNRKGLDLLAKELNKKVEMDKKLPFILRFAENTK